MIRKESQYFILLLLSAFTLVQCSRKKDKKTTQSAEGTITYIIPKPKPISQKEKDRIYRSTELFYDTLLNVSAFNGGIIVAKGGNIVFEKYKGSADLNGKEPITATTSMHVASVSKTFTAMAILKLQEQGKLNIDDSVSKYIPDFNYPGVTIKTLLDHRSGLPNYNHFFEKTDWNKDSMLTNNNVLQYLIAHKAELENIGTPDRSFTYCNTNYALLATIIEKISGSPFPQYMQKNVFDPLGLKNTFVHYKGDNRSVTKSFDWKGGAIPDNYLDMVYGDKNIYTTPEDLLRWDRALSDTFFLNANSLASAYEPYSNEKPGIKNYGFGWHMNIYPNGKKIIFHNGWWHGSTAAFIRLLKDDATIILISNRYARSVYKAKYLVNIFDHYFDNDVAEETENTTVTSAETDSIKKVLKVPISKKEKGNRKDAKLRKNK